ncbi:hypothetical protein FJZ19_04780 [Candidatus Pacearchaeota archaeon]|nr:hypothetical protein [Candidatus Pacearchaeota archaeon]
MKKTISKIEEEYELELDKIVKNIKKIKAKRVLLQFPDGLKLYSTIIVEELEKRTDNKCEFLIWMGSCYGACDIPQTGKIKFDLIVQFGHSAWKR